MTDLASLKASLTSLADAPGLDVVDSAEFYGHEGEGLPLLHYDGKHCRAVIALQGAQVLEFQPAQQPELLWLSPRARFASGYSIRGGIPLCLPWFGPHPSQANAPKHGLARLRDWQLQSARPEGEDLQLRFVLNADAEPTFPHPWRAELTVMLGQALDLTLTLHNTGDQPFDCTWAFHSYLAVADLQTAKVRGLSDCTYLDNTANLAPRQQAGAVTFGGEVDRVYTGVDGQQQLIGETPVRLSGKACDSVVVWNPGPELAARITDIGPHYGEFVCVERGAVFNDRWHLAAAAHRTATLRLEFATVAGGA